MSDATQVLLARYKQKLADSPRPAAQTESSLRRACLHAAAVLDCFTFATFRPTGQIAQRGDARALLFDDVVATSGGAAEQMFSLQLALRQAALRELGTREAMQAALACNPERQRTPLQELWERYLDTGSFPPLEDLRYRDLANVCQVLGWLDGSAPHLPSLEQARDWLRRRSVFASFEHLMAENFIGRKNELAMLRDHIGALPPVRGIEAAWRQLREWVTLRKRPILAIHGVGGIGKSALIGRLLWEHAIADHEVQIPFAYLTFDQPSLRVDATFTLLREAVSQLELQFPEHAGAFATFREGVLEFRDSRGALVSRKTRTSTRGERTSLFRLTEQTLHQRFASMLQTIGRRTIDGSVVNAPIVLVFDTFEEVQYRDRESLTPFWRMLDELQEAYPPLRVIICGRAAVSAVNSPTAKLREEIMPELALPDRVTLLIKLGVADAALAAGVAEQVGGNPLTLRLAARVVSAEPEAATGKGIDSLVTRRFLFFQINEQMIQGQLYRRVLKHIHDPNVRKLAHPGMVLRRVDPQVILHVLAPLCLPGVTGLDEAQRIFNELHRESSLVTVDASDGALIYRSDIRRSLLRLLEQDRFDEVRRLRRAAISYYSLSDDPISRGEEMYHRLALGEDTPATLDRRWTEGLQSTLATGLDDYADSMKAWLASRMSLEVPRSVYANADTAEWERNITRKVQAALSEGQAEAALRLLGERSERTPASPLYALEAKAYLHLGDAEHRQRAQDVLERGIGNVTQSPNRGRLAELLWLMAQVALLGTTPDALRADEYLTRALHAVEHAANPLALMHILGQRLLLRRFHPAAYAVGNDVLKQQLAALCESIEISQAYSGGFVIALAAAMLDQNVFPTAFEHLAQALGKAVASVTPEALTGENLQGLDEYRNAWELQEATSPQAAI